LFRCCRNHCNHICYFLLSFQLYVFLTPLFFFCCSATQTVYLIPFLFMKRSVIYTLIKCRIKRNSHNVINHIYQFEAGIKSKILEKKRNKLTKIKDKMKIDSLFCFSLFGHIHKFMLPSFHTVNLLIKIKFNLLSHYLG
jgi:hypothetical protein